MKVGDALPGTMLNLRYGAVPPAMIDMLEHHARRLGLPLGTIEAIGQDLALVESFIVECERGAGEAFAGDLAARSAAVALGAANA